MDVFRFRGNNDAAALCLGDIVTQGPRYCIERQCAVCQPLNKIQAGHLFLLVAADGPICSVGNAGRHFPSSSENRG